MSTHAGSAPPVTPVAVVARPDRDTDIVVAWQDDALAIEVRGGLDHEIARTVLHLVAAVDVAIGMDDVLVRVDRRDGVTARAWRALQEAGLRPTDGEDGRLVLRPTPRR